MPCEVHTEVLDELFRRQGTFTLAALENIIWTCDKKIEANPNNAFLFFARGLAKYQAKMLGAKARKFNRDFDESNRLNKLFPKASELIIRSSDGKIIWNGCGFL